MSVKGYLWIVGALIVGVAVWWFGLRPMPSAQDGQVLVPQLSALESEGSVAFAQNCATCHGENGSGSDQGPPLIHKIYEPNHHPDFTFIRAARQGVRSHHWRFGDMPPVDGIEEDEVKKIIAYIRRLQQHNGIF